MSDENKNKPKQQTPGMSQDKIDARAAALRANLKKRKKPSKPA